MWEIYGVQKKDDRGRVGCLVFMRGRYNTSQHMWGMGRYIYANIGHYQQSRRGDAGLEDG